MNEWIGINPVQIVGNGRWGGRGPCQYYYNSSLPPASRWIIIIMISPSSVGPSLTVEYTTQHNERTNMNGQGNSITLNQNSEYESLSAIARALAKHSVLNDRTLFMCFLSRLCPPWWSDSLWMSINHSVQLGSCWLVGFFPFSRVQATRQGGQLTEWKKKKKRECTDQG